MYWMNYFIASFNNTTKNMLLLYMFSLFYLYLFCFPLYSIEFFTKPVLFSFRLTGLFSKKYELSEEYYKYYQQFRSPLIKNSNTKPNLETFIEKNKGKYNLFVKNWHLINKTNKELQQQNSSLVLGLNEFMDSIDMESEPSDLMTNPIIDKKFRPSTYLKIFQSPFPYLETILNQNKQITYNWNDTGLLSPIKNQGRCGSCWAFASTTSLETFMRINGYNVSRLSEQELVDCSKENYGCDGGLMHLAFDYIIDNKGLVSHDNYPYKGKDQNCSNKQMTNVIGSNLKDYQFVIPNSVLDMKLSVIKTPVTIALDADNPFFRFYKSGVIDVPQNYSKSLNHAVLLVGFDYDEKGMYWIIQNSWGVKWGDHGFCKLRVQPNEGTLLCQQYGVYPNTL